MACASSIYTPIHNLIFRSNCPKSVNFDHFYALQNSYLSICTTFSKIKIAYICAKIIKQKAYEV